MASLALADLGTLMVARARAGTAADAAALAAAVEIALGSPDEPGEQAGRLARANGARLVACRCPSRAGAVTVLVEVDVPFSGRLLPRRVRIGARARADARTSMGVGVVPWPAQDAHSRPPPAGR